MKRKRQNPIDEHKAESGSRAPDDALRFKGRVKNGQDTWAAAVAAGRTERLKKQGEIWAEMKRPELQRAADQSNELARRAQAADYEEPIWPLDRVLAWIAFRQPDQINRSFRAAKLYDHESMKTHDGPPLVDADPRRTLLRALQTADLRAFDEQNYEVTQNQWRQVKPWDLGDGHRQTGLLTFDRADVLELFAAERAVTKTSDSAALSHYGPTNIGGRPPSFDWTTVRAEMVRLMNHHGYFSRDDPAWNSRSKLENMLIDFCAQRFDSEPNQSTLQGYLRKWIPEWLEIKSSSRTSET